MNNINKINDFSFNTKINNSNKNTQKSDVSFADILQNTIQEVNESQKNADLQASKVATGEVNDLHAAAIAISKAERDLSFMLEVRNKAINAYKELSRTQI